MAIPEDVRARVAEWCAALVPESLRDERRIGYTTAGDHLTILDRRPPEFPELGAVWASTPLAQLRRNDPSRHRWSLYIAGPEGGPRWERQEPSADDPFALPERIESALRSTGP
ncbi:MAG: hypothetical protein OJJ54_02070 [Pseudonocardia sp.]|nr:hypothetical protein [Pseudonocardia sp.]